MVQDVIHQQYGNSGIGYVEFKARSLGAFWFAIWGLGFQRGFGPEGA